MTGDLWGDAELHRRNRNSKMWKHFMRLVWGVALFALAIGAAIVFVAGVHLALAYTWPLYTLGALVALGILYGIGTFVVD